MIPAMIPLEVEIVGSIRDVPGPGWDALTADLPPFLGRAWLAATEEHGPVAREDGWAPSHVLMRAEGVLVAAVPMYLRDRSDGEFVWHGTMEDALTRSGLDIAPRAVGTVPATPVPSPRLLTAPGWSDAAGRRAVLDVLAQLGDQLGWASTHLQFCEEEEAAAADPQVWIHRLTRQARWRRNGATTVEEWLAQYRRKRRASIRREMKELGLQGLEVRFVRGSEASEELVRQAAALHEGTAVRYGESVRFGLGFFEAVVQDLGDAILFVVAAPSGGGEPVGIAMEVVHGAALYGRLWGAADRIRFLHFNVAMYGGIRFCIENGLDRFEPGHGGFHKERRGFPTEPAHSLHRYMHRGAHRSFADWAKLEWDWTREQIEASEAESGLK